MKEASMKICIKNTRTSIEIMKSVEMYLYPLYNLTVLVTNVIYAPKKSIFLNIIFLTQPSFFTFSFISETHFSLIG